MTNTSYQLHELPDIAREILAAAHSKTLLFYGEMGTGKTSLIKELCAQLKSDDVISSPTFSLVNEYHYPEGKLFHFDFYRIDNEEEAWAIGFEEYLDENTYVFIEWPEKIPHLIPERHTAVYLEKQTPDKRALQLKNKG